MSLIVTRKGSGPALITAVEARPQSRGAAWLWVGLALLVALFLAMPAFAQAVPAPASPAVGDAVDLMRTLKRALDPRDLFNPGKIFTN